MEERELSELKKEFGKNKIMPAEYEAVILKALSFYPELKDIHITFKLSGVHPVPYGTTPDVTSIFRKPANRHYTMTFLTRGRGPEVKALFPNLPEEAQLGVLGHELAHVAQYNNCRSTTLVKIFLFFPLVRKVMEQDADRQAIQHGLGNYLHKHATYIRSIPGYTRQRPQINIYYLTPHEIMAHLKSSLVVE